jgi:hypothetical protein
MMTIVTGRRAIAAVAAALLVLGLGACSSGDAEVPSLGASARTDTAPSSASEEGLAAKQTMAAKALAACLKDEGIESDSMAMGVTGYDEEFQLVMPAPASDKWLVVTPGGGGSSSGNEDFPETPEEPTFIDGEKDLTEEYTACLASSGYFIPDPNWDPKEEELDKQKAAETSNRWAACARDNGYPQVKDTAVVVDNYDTYPEVILPGSITAPQLRELLGKCSPLDPARDLKAGREPQDGSVPYDPKIGFDLPEGDPKRDALRSEVDEFIVGVFEKAGS